MPFPEPETALPATIFVAHGPEVIPRNSCGFEPPRAVLRTFNHLQKFSTTYTNTQQLTWTIGQLAGCPADVWE